jgi:hypothetical protein
MKSYIWDRISGTLELDLPKDLDTLDAYIEFVVPKVQPWSEDLQEETFYLGKRWKEVRDTDTHLESVLHIFMPPNEYLISIDGDISKGSWRYFKETNTLIIDYGDKSQLYDLVFMNSDFFILAKHGDQARKGKDKYRFYVEESLYLKKNLDWRSSIDELFNVYRSSTQFSMLLFMLVAFIVLVLAISFA